MRRFQVYWMLPSVLQCGGIKFPSKLSWSFNTLDYRSKHRVYWFMILKDCHRGAVALTFIYSYIFFENRSFKANLTLQINLEPEQMFPFTLHRLCICFNMGQNHTFILLHIHINFLVQDESSAFFNFYSLVLIESCDCVIFRSDQASKIHSRKKIAAACSVNYVMTG